MSPVLRNAFLGKADLRLKCGEVASKSYDKLKEILNIVTRGGTEIFVQEDGALSTQSKRTGEVILTALFFALPSHVKNRINDLEVYKLARVEIPRTVECFSKLVVDVKVILS
ncbi:1572_t:CDS:2 [Gigaspora rosea]|nr:1572_t:CDS:2 [Gigaspora rosea]